MVKHLQAIRRQEPTNYLSMFDHFETGLQYLGMSVAMLSGGLRVWGGAGWWLPCLASGGNSCRLWQLGRSGWVLFPWVRVGPIFVRIGPFRGFLALLPRSSFWWGDWGLGYHSVV